MKDLDEFATAFLARQARDQQQFTGVSPYGYEAAFNTSESERYEFIDRYSALGVVRPDPKTMCKGQCEGLGYYPTSCQYDPRWQEAHRKNHTLLARLRLAWRFRDLKAFFEGCSGYHFVKCEECDGTGNAKADNV